MRDPRKSEMAPLYDSLRFLRGLLHPPQYLPNSQASPITAYAK